jgi:hypothetical protein
MNLISVEYDEKDLCISQLTKSLQTYIFYFKNYWKINSIDSKVDDVEFWTSGTDFECEGKFMWCNLNRRFVNRNMNWANDVKGDCVSVKYSNGSSTFSKNDCRKELNYICEVKITGLNKTLPQILNGLFSRREKKELLLRHCRRNACRCGMSLLVCFNFCRCIMICNFNSRWYACFSTDLWR